MAKRFTDTEKWKKPFIRGLDASYKLLWFYILDDCDHAGIWQVDFEVARIRTGEQFDYQTALSIFSDRIVVIDKFKWFIPDFVEFQYGELSDKNRLHQSVLNILQKYKLGPCKVLVRSQGQGQGQGQGIQDSGDLEKWSDLIVENNDPVWEQMRGRRVSRSEMDQFISVAIRCDWKIDTAQAFRLALKGFEPNKTNGQSQTNRGKIQ